MSRRRTKLLLTFGSPLDKTAFLFRLQESKEADVREALAAAVQPMIADTANRPAAWINIWSPRDWISGKVDYYQRPCEPFVTNVRDPEAAIPILAHTQYLEELRAGAAALRAVVTPEPRPGARIESRLPAR